MNVKCNYWGEFDHNECHAETGLSSSDMEDLLKPRSPSRTTVTLHQPSPNETSSFQILPSELLCSDPLVFHTIELLQYQREVAQMIVRAQSIGHDNGSLPSFPGLPANHQLKGHSSEHPFLNYISPEISTGEKKKHETIEMESGTARQILRKAVATVCAHSGFSDTTESILQMLTDVTHEFLIKFTQVLRSNADAYQLTGYCPFHDLVEQTLHDTGIGSMSDLWKMYKQKVLIYHERVQQEALQLQRHYQDLLHQLDDASSTNVKYENVESWNEDGSSQYNTPQNSGIEGIPLFSVRSTSTDKDIVVYPQPAINPVAGEEVRSRAPVNQYIAYTVTPR